MNNTRIVPLGGLGHFGANATIIQTPKTSILIDFGLMFPPDKRQPGVDFYINNPEKILDEWPDLEAIFITHGHEDHIGGLFYLLKRKSLPIYATTYTAELIRSADPMIKKPDLREVEANQPVHVGDLKIEFIPVTHSIATACCLYIESDDGCVLHSGDFKLDPNPGDGGFFGVERLRELAGVDLLMMDSTNAEQRGFSGSESELLDTYQTIFEQSQGRILISTFSSSLPRLINVSRIARKFNRKVALIGRSFLRHYNAAIKAGYLKPDSVFVNAEEARDLPPGQLAYFVTGSQGEVNAALNKIAHKTHPEIKITNKDTVVFASRAIPGNERAIALLRSELERSGARVITPKHMHVHVSGHAYREELAYLLSLVQPHHILPIHGEYTMLQRHFTWLNALSADGGHVLLASNGDELVMKSGHVKKGSHWDCELLPIDGNQLVPVSKKALKQRKDMMYSGLVMVCGQREVGRMNWQVDTLGIAEQEQGNLQRIVEHTLARKGQVLNPKLLKKELKKAIRPHYYGMPIIKIFCEGRII